MTQTGFQIAGDAPERYERTVAPIMAPFIEAAVERAGVRPGAAVLDVACGTGFVTRRVAEVAGAGARVAGLDVNAGMLARARSTGAGASGAALEWHEASALELPFGDGEFDAVVCQQGVQFFPDLERAAREMHRVLRAGGRAVATFWAAVDEQTYFRVQHGCLERAIGQTMAGAFALDPERARAVLSAAGFRDVAIERVEATVTLPPMDGYAAEQVGALPLAQAFGAASDEARAAYVREMEAGLAPWRTPSGEHACPTVSWLVCGVK